MVFSVTIQYIDKYGFDFKPQGGNHFVSRVLLRSALGIIGRDFAGLVDSGRSRYKDHWPVHSGGFALYLEVSLVSTA